MNEKNTGKTIAILSVSAGAGHMRAAESVKAAADKYFPGTQAVHIDLMTLVNDIFRKMYAESYLSIVEKHPSLWGYLYRKSDRQDHDSAMNKVRRAIQRLNTGNVMTKLREIAPDIVVCTHFLPAELLSREIRQGGWDKPTFVQVTDFDIHTMWLHEGMTGYFAATEEVAFKLADRGIPRETIRATGIPIMPVFAETRDRAACAAEIGADPKKTTFLMMSGGFGVGGIDGLAERLLAIPGEFQIIALAGKNEQLLVSLRSLAAKHPGRLFPMGFTRTIERVMACADLAITKPGGLTTSECLAVGLPMLVVSAIPGQEERNADFLLENGAAMKAYDPAALEFRIRAILANPGRLASMRDQAKRLARPHAARDLLAAILEQR
ncbi:MAG TPA: glycosyltransferase [Candidatus Ozemobacteraceae bacterium]|nr:glycosyltransferase [Candidatus Ozemobacteraceae bacterium]